jgi:hypothetical protein
MGTAEKSDAKYSYKDYLNGPETERWEIINGVPCAFQQTSGCVKGIAGDVCEFFKRERMQGI